jgi:hypothetical protein
VTDNLPFKPTGDKEMDDLFTWATQQGNKSLNDHAVDTATEIREIITPQGEPQPQQGFLACCPMPTDLCRVSPFFPMSTQDMPHRDFIRDMVITSNSWGEIRYTGPRLSTYEEDVLVALLALLNEIKHRQHGEVEGRSTYVYKGPVRPIMTLMGIKRPNQDEYKKVISALKLMAVAGMDLCIQKRTTRGKSKTESTTMTNMLSMVKWDEKEKVLTVAVNPFFYETYMAGTVTLLDVVARSKLKTPSGKCLYRFMQSHREEKWSGHYLTLGASLNLDLEQKPAIIKRRIEGALSDMKRSGLLAVGSKLDGDLVKLHRPPIKPRKRQIVQS